MTRKHTRTRIEDIRRKELITAAHRVFLQHGLGGMTTKRICEAAGMSPGILSYYFNGKEDVLYAMVRWNNRVLMDEVVAGMNRAQTGWQRLQAIVAGNFPASHFDPTVANAWLSVCAASANNPRYARLQHIFYQRLGSNLSSVFAAHLPPPDLRDLTLTTSALIDGLWLRRATGFALTPAAAAALVLTRIEAMIDPDLRARLDLA